MRKGSYKGRATHYLTDMIGYRLFWGGLCDNKNVEGRLRNCRVFGEGDGEDAWWRGECGGEGLRVEGPAYRVVATTYCRYIIHYFSLDFNNYPSDNFADSTEGEILKSLF